MELNSVRAVLTVVAFVTFVGIVLWAYSRGARKGFNEAEKLPFADDNANKPN